MSRRSFAPLLVLSFAFVLPAPARAEGRSETFQTYCSVCHGDDGKAQTEQGKEKGARDLTNAKWQARESDKDFEKAIRKGKGKMPSFEKKLSDDEIKALIQEVRSLAAPSK